MMSHLTDLFVNMTYAIYKRNNAFGAFSVTSLILMISLQSSLQGIKAIYPLLYPPNATSFGINFGVSVPVTEFFPERRILIDWCFTISYNLPSAISQFYNVQIWPKPKKRDLRWQHEVSAMNMTLDIPSYSHLYDKYKEPNGLRPQRHPNDYTAGEFYMGIEDILISHGFHETCLLRAVCELARHPFDENLDNFLTDTITFLLTPSQHEAFGSNEDLYREVYEDAEKRGFMGENCSMLYYDCKIDFLSMLTKVALLMTDNDNKGM